MSEHWRSSLRRLRRVRPPTRAALAAFLAELRGPTRTSVARALVDGVVVIVTLETRGVRPLFGRPVATTAVVDPERSRQVAAAVDAALGVLPASPSCLRRSVTLLRELHRLDLAATMHIGVRGGGDRVEAHAWVQAGDEVINDSAEVTTGYAELAHGDLERFLPLLQ